jgi:hypothetical protein
MAAYRYPIRWDTAGAVTGSPQAGVVVTMESSTGEIGERDEALLWSYPWFPVRLVARPLPYTSCPPPPGSDMPVARR